MLPKLEFVYSGIYDTVFSGSKTVSYRKRIEGMKLAKKLQKVWDRHSKRILSCMSKITGLKWPKSYIECILSFNAPYSFSHPLTLKIYKRIPIERCIVVLIHELAHILLWGNREKVKFPRSNAKIYKKYKNESYQTKLHFPVYAIEILTIKKVFGKNAEKYLRIAKWWEISQKSLRAKNYKKSWEIVEKEGPENVIKSIIRLS